jgi:hypothetical protein
VTKVMIVCPVTERRIPIGVQVHATRAFRRELPHSGSVLCGACHRTHSWDRRETLLEGAPISRRRDGEIEPKVPTIRYVLRRDLAQY